MLLLELK